MQQVLRTKGHRDRAIGLLTPRSPGSGVKSKSGGVPRSTSQGKYLAKIDEMDAGAARYGQRRSCISP